MHTIGHGSERVRVLALRLFTLLVVRGKSPDPKVVAKAANLLAAKIAATPPKTTRGVYIMLWHLVVSPPLENAGAMPTLGVAPAILQPALLPPLLSAMSRLSMKEKEAAVGGGVGLGLVLVFSVAPEGEGGRGNGARYVAVCVCLRG